MIKKLGILYGCILVGIYDFFVNVRNMYKTETQIKMPVQDGKVGKYGM